MPTYSYKCPTCGHAFDIQQSFTDDSLTDCPNCGGALRKVFSAVGVTFNGSGFYRTDSRPGGAPKDAGTGSPAPAATPASAPAPAAASSSSTSTSSTPAKSTTSAS
ncbi:FmdB family transcriptional regulator [Diaminobutyricibacter tongyongensis]|uniref:FmdB family transcriptional regulator n=1 Tax=Leifsonia tongyongensis TaxID=1268043 RepID=A0A6L9Y0B7_9MICO|nr:FmdB family transcriptional regulator [Diaminobutyricibacter tongyongensis]